MIKITDEKRCCGCFACKECCPTQSIIKKEGTLGHLFPIVDTNRCVSCGLCETVCPMVHSKRENNFINACCAYSKDDSVLKRSSSGGLFYSIASTLLSKGFVVYGAAFNENLKLCITKVDNISDLEKLCKSKYLQANSGGCYKEVLNDLSENKNVLFCSTPCQVSALKNFLKKDYENLITIDFFCHGVPSQEYFDKSLKLFERKNNVKVTDFQFRTKIKNGNTPHYYTVEYIAKNGVKHRKIDYYYNSYFYAAFQKYLTIRESCYYCSFSSLNRDSDITLGDFHNVDNYFNGINRFKGVSLFLCNSKKGLHIKDELENNVVMQNIDINLLIKNKEILQPTLRPNLRDQFVKDFDIMDFDKFNRKYFNKHNYWKHRIYYHSPKLVRKSLKRIISQ